MGLALTETGRREIFWTGNLRNSETEERKRGAPPEGTFKDLFLTNRSFQIKYSSFFLTKKLDDKQCNNLAACYSWMGNR
jgi:hypothetical protein